MAFLAVPPAGLSPHGRGNQYSYLIGVTTRGPIPAWAGEPQLDSVELVYGMAYPRMGGGTVVSLEPAPRFTGLSPHGRGNPGGADVAQLGQGPIPAWAGEP